MTARKKKSDNISEHPARGMSFLWNRQEWPAPYWGRPGAALYLGEVRDNLRLMPARSVHTCITSPPYWGLRDYGTAQWEGGNPECVHEGKKKEKRDTTTYNNSGNYTSAYIARIERDGGSNGVQFGGYCVKCGARRIDHQIGSEPSPDCGTHGQAQCGQCFVCSMVSVFREVRRVLRDDGTVWLNLGDSYSSGGRGGGQNGSEQQTNKGSLLGPKHTEGVADGNLIGAPWRVALALQADGWLLRQDIIWHSPDKMPESVTNRCTKSHEHIFLLAKSHDYYFDHIAIQEDDAGPVKARRFGTDGLVEARNKGKRVSGNEATGALWENTGKKNKRDVWIVSKGGYSGAHYAVFSPDLITPCILAGTSEHGCCAQCGKSYERVVVREGGPPPGDDGRRGDFTEHASKKTYDRDRSLPRNRNGLESSGSTLDSKPMYKSAHDSGTVSGKTLARIYEEYGYATNKTVGWRKTCGCRTDEVSPCVVLDPFVGSGTTVATSNQLGRYGVGIDLSQTYLDENAIPRIVEAVQSIPTHMRKTVAVSEDRPPTPKAFS